MRFLSSRVRTEPHNASLVIAEALAPEPLAWLKDQASVTDATALDRHGLLAALGQAAGLVVRTYTRVDQELLDHAPNLKVVARAGVGLDNIDLEACRRRGVVVVHTPDANSEAVVEYVAQQMLTALRPIARLEGALARQEWDALRARAVTERSCVGATLGIVGLGKIGSRLAGVGAALGMRVIYHDLVEIPEARRHSATPVSLDRLLGESDVISLHVDGRAENQGLVGAGAFAMMRDDAVLINAARGFIIDASAAAAFARERPNARLILDVHEPEPVASESPMLGLPNVVLTPHIGAGTAGAKTAMSWVVRDAVRVLRGQRPQHPAP